MQIDITLVFCLIGVWFRLFKNFFKPQNWTGYTLVAPWAMIMNSSSFENPKSYLIALTSKDSKAKLLRYVISIQSTLILYQKLPKSPVFLQATVNTNKAKRITYHPCLVRGIHSVRTEHSQVSRTCSIIVLWGHGRDQTLPLAKWRNTVFLILVSIRGTLVSRLILAVFLVELGQNTLHN